MDFRDNRHESPFDEVGSYNDEDYDDNDDDIENIPATGDEHFDKSCKLQVFNFYTDIVDNRVKCKECGMRLSVKHINSKSLISHLRSKHPFLINKLDVLDNQNKKLTEEPHKVRNTEKRSHAWIYYCVVSREQAKCNECQAVISTKMGSTKGCDLVLC